MTKKKVVVVGNCQARPIATLLEAMSDEIEVTKIAIVHLLNSDQEEEYKPFFEEADHIIAQLVTPNYPCEFVRTESLKEKYGDKVTTIVNLFFRGYSPDWRYVRIPGKGTLKGPMGDYHNQTILESWLKGLKVEDTIELLKNVEYNTQQYGSVVKESLKELGIREINVDVKICDYIRSEMFNQRLFFTFNHPTKALLTECSMRLLKAIKLKVTSTNRMQKEPLNQLIPVLNCGVGFDFPLGCKHKGLTFELIGEQIKLGKSKEYDDFELVSSFYQVYSKNTEVISGIKL